MPTHAQGAEPLTHPGPTPWRLTDALNAKLAALNNLGFEVLWIESSRDDLTRLVMEGGDSAIRLDPDQALDRAWFGDVEIRHTTERDMTWIFLRGEVASGEVSAHVIAPPGQANPAGAAGDV